MSYKSPIEDFKYNLAMLNYDEIIAGIEKFKEYDSETLMSVVSEIGRLNEPVSYTHLTLPTICSV